MSHGIPPYRPTGPEFDPRQNPRVGPDAEPEAADTIRPAGDAPAQGPRTRPTEPGELAFGAALEGAMDRPAGPVASPDLSPDEQQMILRYFPEAPGLALRIYDQNSSSRKVDPGSLGARVDLRG